MARPPAGSCFGKGLVLTPVPCHEQLSARPLADCGTRHALCRRDASCNRTADSKVSESSSIQLASCWHKSSWRQPQWRRHPKGSRVGQGFVQAQPPEHQYHNRQCLQQSHCMQTPCRRKASSRQLHGDSRSRQLHVIKTSCRHQASGIQTATLQSTRPPADTVTHAGRLIQHGFQKTATVEQATCRRKAFRRHNASCRPNGFCVRKAPPLKTHRLKEPD